MITQNELHSLLHYDPISGVFTWKERGSQYFKSEKSQKTFNTRFSGKVAGYVDKKKHGNEYVKIMILDCSYYAHRLAFLYCNNTIPDEIDHIDGDGLNNRIENLRSCDSSENSRNMKLFSTSRTRVCGVSLHSSGVGYVVQIGVNGSGVYLGYYRDFFEACCVRKSAEKSHKYHKNHGSDRR